MTAEEVEVILSARTRQYEADLKRARQTFDKAVGGQEQRVKMLERQIRTSSSHISSTLRGLAGTFATVFTGRELVRLVDSFTRLQNSLRVAGLEGADLERVQSRLLDLSSRYGVSVEGLANLYGKATDAGRSFGASEAQILQLTEATSQSLLITGTNAQQASGAILGLSQALASGIVRAEEYNQINEGGLRPLLQAAAATERFGGDVNKLRMAVVNGTVTSQEFFSAIMAGSAQLEGRAAKATLTLSGAMEALTSQLTVYFGEAGKGSGATEALASAIQALADNLDTIIPALAVVAGALGVRYVAGAVAASGATRALVAHLSIATTSMAGTALAAQSAGRALLTAFGGPVGIAILGVSAALYQVYSEGERANEMLARYSDAAETAASRADELEKRLTDAKDGMGLAGRAADDASDKVSVLSDTMLDAAGAAFKLFKQLQQLETVKLTARINEAKADRERLQAQARRRAYTPSAYIPGGGFGVSVAPTVSLATEESAAIAKIDRTISNLERQRAALNEAASLGLDISDPAAPGAPASAGTGTGKKAKRPPGGRTLEDIEDDRRRIAQRALEEETRLEIEELQARLELATTAGDRASLGADLLRLEGNLRRRQIENDENFTEDQKKAQLAYLDRLYGKPGQTGPNGEIVVQGEPGAYAMALSREAREEELRMANDALARQAAVLDAQAAITHNLDQRDRLEQKALELQQQIERNLLDQDIANGRITSADEAIAQLAEKQAADRAKLAEYQQTPLERYQQEMERTATNIDREIEAIHVRGLQNLNDGLAEAITGAKSLGDVFSDVADQIINDLIRIAIQQAIIQPLAALLGGGGGGGGLGAVLGDFIGSAIFGRATGGPINAGQPYMVGERGPELVVPQQAGVVVPNHRLTAPSAGGGTTQVIQVDARGAVMNDQFASMILRQARAWDAETGARTLREADRRAPAAVQRARRYGR